MQHSIGYGFAHLLSAPPRSSLDGFFHWSIGAPFLVILANSLTPRGSACLTLRRLISRLARGSSAANRSTASCLNSEPGSTSGEGSAPSRMQEALIYSRLDRRKDSH